MTVIFVITKNKYFNVIEETAQTMCMEQGSVGHIRFAVCAERPRDNSLRF